MKPSVIRRLKRLTALSVAAPTPTLFADGEPVTSIELIKPGEGDGKGREVPSVCRPTWVAFLGTDAYYAKVKDVERFERMVPVSVT